MAAEWVGTTRYIPRYIPRSVPGFVPTSVPGPGLSTPTCGSLGASLELRLPPSRMGAPLMRREPSALRAMPPLLRLTTMLRFPMYLTGMVACTVAGTVGGAVAGAVAGTVAGGGDS